MKKFSRILILCTALSAVTLVTYLLLPPSASGQRAVEQLKSVRTFSLGPVGPSGRVPESVDQFFTILASRHSSRLFRDLYEGGTPEAKLYALCGLWITNGGFDRYSARFLNEVEKVSTLSACFSNERLPGEVVDAIGLGAVDHSVSLLRSTNPKW